MEQHSGAEKPVSRVTDSAVGQEHKRRGLRRMKLVALSFLAGAMVIFLLASWARAAGWPAWVGYVRAAAEAGMVGGIADWFAVTALFRHPLRIPIPHTAIIPNKKDVLGSSLSDFVDNNFLSPEIVGEKLDRVEVSRRIGDWLSQQHNAQRVTSELATVLRGAVTVLRDEDVQVVMQQSVVRRVVEQPWGPPLGRILDRVFADGAHHNLVDLVTDRCYEWVRDNHETMLRVVSDRAPNWSPRFVDEMFADKVYGEVVAFAWAVKTDVNDPMRMALDKFLAEFAQDLQTDPDTMDRAERVKRQILEHDEVQKLISSAWTTAKELLLAAVEDPDSELRVRLHAGLVNLGHRLTSDAALREKVDGWVRGGAGHVVANYSQEITTIITDTVRRWDTAETARKVELQVGKDLQFIRINGTVVGALAGLVIHTIAAVLF